MAQMTLKYPLEFWWETMLFQVICVATWFGIDTLYKRKAAAKTYHGAALVLPDYNSGKYQEALAAAIVWARGKGTARSETPAIFIQKVREWIDYNTARGKPDVRPYYSYQEWCDEHFPCHNEASLQRVVSTLEELGLIITEQFNARDLRKRYALDETAIAALMDRWSLAFPETARKFRGATKSLAIESKGFASESTRFNIESGRFDSARHSSSKSIQESNALIKKTTPPQAAAAAQLEAPALMEMKKEGTGEGTEDVQKDVTGDSDLVGSIPRSEAPLTQIDAQAAKIWDMARGQLASRDEVFQRWMKDAELRAYECIDGVATYRIGGLSAQAKDLLQRRYYRNVAQVFGGLYSGPIKIEFEVGA